MEENVKAVLQRIPKEKLHAFNNHPFSVRRDEAMEKLVDSVRVNGILNPVLVRPRSNGDYEIIAGHRRTEAARILGLPFVPCFVCDLDDDHAIIAMIDSNLSQRENLPPSERAFALRMKTEAARRIMLSTKGRSEVKRASENVAKDSGMSARQVERFIKLTELNRQLLNMLDDNRLGMDAAVELANLTTEAQCWIYDYITEHNMTLNTAQAKKLRQALQPDDATEALVAEVLAAPVKPARKAAINAAAQAVVPEQENREAPVMGDVHENEYPPQPAFCQSDDLPDSVLDEPLPDMQSTKPVLDYDRISAYYPPGTPVEFINDDLCKMLEATRKRRLNEY